MIGQDIKFDFDDILIIPSVTTFISSRYKDITLPDQLPLFTAPMDTVVNLENWKTFINKGISVCLPRTVSTHEVFMGATQFPTMKFQDANEGYHKKMMFPSVGLGDIDKLLSHKPILETFDNILIDVANGHMRTILSACGKIRDINPDIKIMVGNIGNPETYWYYAHSDLVDYIRVGIGNGGGCLTTKQSGVGYPMASLIHETYLIKQQFLKEVKHRKEYGPNVMGLQPYKRIPAIVADGGMKDYADIIKSLALGADFVMIGSILNKALESCAQNYKNGKEIDQKTAEKLFKKGIEIKKLFRGMSTKAAQKAMGKTTVKTSEGVERFRKVEYDLDHWVENFNHYLRNAMSYANAETLDEFIGKAKICQITKNAYDRFNK